METETQKRKEAKISSMRSKEYELRQAQWELTSANENLSGARRRREEAERKRRASLFGAGVFAVVTLGVGAPALAGVAPIAMCASMALDAISEEKRAKRNIADARNKISQCEGEISQYQSEIRQLDNEIPALSQQIRHLKSE